MALSLEDAALVRQKVYAAFGGVSNEAKHTKLYWNLARELFNKLNTEGVASLQFVEFDDTTATTGDGQDHGIDAAHKLYFVYCKKRATGTDSYLQVIDDADNDSEAPGDVRVTLALLASGEEVCAVYPEGLAMADGLVTTFTTLPAADSQAQSTAGDGGDGFYVIGAA